MINGHIVITRLFQQQVYSMCSTRKSYISSSTWTYGNQTNGYYYFYDNLNRLTYEYSLLNGSFGDYAYTENYNYDSRGNITSLYRWNAADIMDGLVMEYNGNQLKAVSNDYQMIAPAYNAKHYQDLADETTEMLYDQNGNLIVNSISKCNF